MSYDINIFEFLNGFAGHWRIVDALGIFLADYLAYALGLLLVCFLFWPKKDLTKNRVMVLVAIISGLIAKFIVKSIILLFYNRPRPYITSPLVHKLIPTSVVENFQSFPSGHVTFFFAVSMAVYFYNKKLGLLFFICSTLMGIARVFVGVHWPSDILSGAILGTITAYAIQKIYVKFANKVSS